MAETFVTSTDCGCESPAYNPKEGLGQVRKRCGSFGDFVCDPVAAEIRDYDEARFAYSVFPIIPFFEGGDATLDFFRQMREQSPTHGACIEKIGTYTFGEGLAVKRAKRPGFVTIGDQVDVGDDEANEFIDFIESFNPDFDGDDLLDEMWRSHEMLKTYGNYFIRLDMVTVGGQKFVFLKCLETEDCRYMLKEGLSKDTLLVSPNWNLQWFLQKSPLFLPVHPSMLPMGDGMTTTIIHIKNEAVKRPWYGLPDSFTSLRYQLLEAQMGRCSTENYANDFIPRTIIEIEEDAEEKDDGFDAAITASYTNRGSATERKRVVIRRRLPDEKQMAVHEVKANTDHEYHSAMAEVAEAQITKAHKFNKILLGASVPGRMGQNQEFAQIYKEVNFSTIKPYRRDLLSGWQKALNLADAFMNGKRDVTLRMSIDCDDLFKEYLQTDGVETPQETVKTETV